MWVKKKKNKTRRVRMFSHTDKKEDTLESGGILKLEWVGWWGLFTHVPLYVAVLFMSPH